MSRYDDLEKMLITVALALGDNLLEKVVFVGGCTTGLFISDSATRESIRYTEDVDLIVDVIGFSQWNSMQRNLEQQGFTINPEDDVLCRMRLGNLKVDFMPDDESILGFTNRWYADAIEHANFIDLSDGTAIRLISPEYFIATKLEAFLGRGNNDPLSSRDIEDILNVIDGRPKLIQEIQNSDERLREYIAATLARILEHSDFQYAVQSTARNSQERENMIYDRLEIIIR